MPSYLKAPYGSVLVSYTQDLDGGGNTFGRTYEAFVRQHFGSVESVFEWCAGPGFIGFSLLASGLCKTLDLSDVNPDAERAVEATVRENSLDGQVRFHLSDSFTQVAAGLRWDLMVGNPPHVNQAAPASDYQHSHSALIWKDTDWSIHRDFYAAAPRFLRPGGSVVIQENYRFSQPSDFTEMIEGAGLETVGTFDCGPGFEDYYFLWSRLSESRPPAENQSR
ncbi:methyltransferase [Streptomyces sp. NPDC058257]|uniref:methyltransferase n=1 Tax=Streptomyces sp. NPDC058257 TaxID=3346409 RepID=UPI0036E1A78D